MFSFLIPWNHLSSLPALTRSFSHIPAANYIMTSQKGNWFCFLYLPPPSESSRPFQWGIWTWDSTEVAVTRLQWPSSHSIRSSIFGTADLTQPWNISSPEFQRNTSTACCPAACSFSVSVVSEAYMMLECSRFRGWLASPSGPTLQLIFHPASLSSRIIFNAIN